MKTIAILLLTTCACVAASSALKPQGKSVPLTLSDYTIELPANPTGPEKKAASDLQHWVHEMSGGEFPIRAGGAKAIKIVTNPNFADEQYQIAVEGEALILTGGAGRGVINAAYALLEEDIGCRFYTNDSIVIPKTSQIEVVPRTFTPKLILRDPFYFASFDAEWSLRNRTNAPDAKVPEESGGRVDYGGLFVHTHAGLLPPDKYFKDHPEYFAMDAGGKRYAAQLCPTNPDVARIVTENVLKALKDNPHAEIVSVSKNDNDGTQICHCEECKKLREAEGGTDMANQLVLVNKVAEAVEKEHPKVFVDTLAYLETIKVPKTIRPRKNVIIRVCNDSVGAWSRPFTPARNLPVADILKQWSAVHDRFSIWDYNINFSHFLAPMPNMDIIADNIRFWVDNHAVGVMTQGGYQSTSERDEMRSWVIAKLMWDPSRDVIALVNDFIEGHYGKSAPMLKEYEALLAASRTEHAKELENPPGGIRYPMTIGFLSKDFLAKTTEIFDRAEKAAGDDAALHNRIERAELPVLYVKLAQGPIVRETLEKFERIARREKVDWLLEWQVRLDQQLDTWKKQLPAPQAISHGPEAGSYQAFPDACRLKNGDIICAFYAGYGHVALPSEDYPKGGRICYVRSSDEGATWTAPKVLYDDDDDNRDSHVAQLDNGDLICTFFSWRLKGEKLKHSSEYSRQVFAERAELIGAQMVRSTDGGATWDKTAKPIHPTYTCSAPVRQLKDGTCVLGLYTFDAKAKIGWGAVTHSNDRGHTWGEVVDIGREAKLPLDAETDIIQLNDGSLLAALRSSKINLHFAKSADLGKTWSTPYDSGFKGESPHLNRLSTGEIVLSVRSRPNTSVHVSRDDGKTWSGPFVIDNVVGAYPSTVELKDKSVLIVYYTEGAASEIRALRFRLTPDGVEKLSPFK